MKYLPVSLFWVFFSFQSFSQGSFPESFLDGKSVVLISNAPQARPAYLWTQLADEVHKGLVAAGGDPVAYYELEDVAISTEVQAGFASQFAKRKISSIVVLTRKANGNVELNIGPFTNNANILPTNGLWRLESSGIASLNESLETIGKTQKSKNYLVIEVPEYPAGASATATSRRFINRNPLNLDVFKLGIPLSGSSGESGFLGTFRYDLLGKSKETIAAEQNAEKSGLEAIFKELYPHQYEFLTSAKSDAELIRDRVQFVLVKVEAREGDLKSNMGLDTSGIDESRIVVKYYIRFLVRDELYIGPIWDADPDWETALRNFLSNLQK
jgi:hypothetical protein